MTAPLEFRYRAQPMRVTFGTGSIEALADEVAALGVQRAVVVATPRQRASAEMVLRLLAGRGVGLFAEAEMHVPVQTAVKAREYVTDVGADGCVTFGGGSSIGLGKAIALECGLPIIAIPTTYSGSEMTSVWGLTDGGEKRTGKDPKVLPASVIYDPALTLGLPLPTAAASGLNAVAHAVEALYAPDRSPIVSLMAEEGVRAFADSLPAIVEAPRDPDLRATALYAAWLCGACLGATTMSLHHKLCHVLGGSLGLPHAETHAALLPYTTAYNEPFAPSAAVALRRALRTDRSAAVALWELGQTLPIPHSLREVGMSPADVGAVVERALTNPYANPAPVTAVGLQTLLSAALEGSAPKTMQIE